MIKKGLSQRVSFFKIPLFCVLYLFSTDHSLMAEEPVEGPVCLIARSDAASDETLDAVVEGLKALGLICQRRVAALTHPFDFTDGGYWGSSEKSFVVGLWLYQSKDGRSFTVRGLDFSSHLQFGMAKAVTQNLTSDSVRDTIMDLTLQVLRQTHMVGFLKRKTMFIWDTSIETLEAHYEREGVRHPLLPKILSQNDSEVIAKARLRAGRIEWQFASTVAEKALDEGKVLWLKQVHER